MVLIGQKSCDSNETGKLRLSLDSRQTHAGMTVEMEVEVVLRMAVVSTLCVFDYGVTFTPNNNFIGEKAAKPSAFRGHVRGWCR